MREKAKSRGCFSHSSKGRGKGKGKKSGKGTWNTWDQQQRRRPLAERIANSSCKPCGQKAHWRRECPRREELKTETTLFTPMDEANDLPEIFAVVPEDAVLYHEDDDPTAEAQWSGPKGQGCPQKIHSLETCFMVSPKVRHALPFETVLARTLLMLDRTTRAARMTPQRPKTDAGKQRVQDTAMVVTEGAEGVLDTGASRTVIGSGKVAAMIQGLDPECRRKIRKVKSGITFRFGNSGTLTSEHALLLPCAQSTWVRVEVVPGNTPLLISNRLLRDLDAVIHVKKSVVITGDGRRIPTRFDERGLTIVDLTDFLKAPPEASLCVKHVSPEKNGPQKNVEVNPEPSQPAPHRAASDAAPNPMQTQQRPTAKRTHPEEAEEDVDQPISIQPQPLGEQSQTPYSLSTLSPLISQHAVRDEPSGAAHEGGHAGGGPRSTTLGQRGCHPADEQLVLSQFVDVEFQKPPGTSSLRAWGETVLPAGKYKGKTHERQDAGRHLARREDGQKGNSRAGAPASAGVWRRDGREVSSEASDCVQESWKPTCTVSEVCDRIDNKVLESEDKLRHSDREIREPLPRYRLPQMDVLEISMNGHNPLKEAVQRRGGRAINVCPGSSKKECGSWLLCTNRDICGLT